MFIRLAKAAPRIRSEGELVTWLHRTTVHASIDLWQSECRRRAREVNEKVISDLHFPEKSEM